MCFAITDIYTAEFRDICNYWQVENMGFVSAKIDEQKTEETKQKVVFVYYSTFDVSAERTPL